MSIFFRQTNAVWVAFTLAVCLLEDFTPSLTPHTHTNGTSTSNGHQRLPTPGSRGHASPVPPLSSSPPPPPPSPATPAVPAAAAAAASNGVGGGSGRFELPCSNGMRQRSNGGGVSGLGNGTRLSPGDKSRNGGGGGSGNGVVVGRQNGLLHSSSSSVSAGSENGNGNGNGKASVNTHYNNNPVDHNASGKNIVENLSSFTAIPSLVLALAGAAWSDACRGGPLLRARLPLAVPVALFAVFVWGFNGGDIVVGDKENHLPGGPPHLAQLAYMVAVGASLWGLFGKEAAVGGDARKGFVRWVRGGTGLVGFAAIVGVVALALWR